MKVILAITVFTITLGGLFAFGGFQHIPSNQTAHILLPSSSQSSLPKATTKKSHTTESTVTSEPLATSFLSSQIATTVITPTPSQSIAYTVTPSPSPRPSTTPSSAPSPTRTTTPAPTPSATIQSTPPPTETPISAHQAIEIITTQPLTYTQKSSAELKIKTIAQANCGLRVTLPSGSISSAKGLESKIADGNGLITWDWNISWNTKPGIGSIVVTCTKDSYSDSETVSITILESK